MRDLTIEHQGKTYANFDLKGLQGQGVPQAAIDKALSEARLMLVKAECRRRIYAQASSETQINMATATAAVAGKAVEDRSAEDLALLTSTKAALDWVNAMRAKVIDLAADPDTGFTLDASWPDCPADVVAIVEQF
ncbi:hypothetical protein [Pseudovibrio sp. Tun.PSC04-5.I4]|uniref:hypothetical protein n=1 Tax=Pseudovibrio sp. Tun.PSC04-5.I4 TaxID=1798213 RepID=UPI00088DD751|nr:hypothetical protein [Pseudovibrio sp. Tun.PSC04-5.I4]SDR15306.1 hypothetical protein SAMN04515695_3045 [Pseudovibrio sp. Tun.PSC04-5.I4]